MSPASTSSGFIFLQHYKSKIMDGKTMANKIDSNYSLTDLYELRDFPERIHILIAKHESALSEKEVEKSESNYEAAKKLMKGK
jgi:hypothetical protein